MHVSYPTYPQPPLSNSVLLSRELKRMKFPLRVGPPTEADIKFMAVADKLDQIDQEQERLLNDANQR